MNMASDDCSFDTEIYLYASEAQGIVEDDTQQQLVPAQLSQRFESFPGVGLPLEFAGPDRLIQLGRRPLLEVQQVSYVDDQEVGQVLPTTDYVVDTTREPGHIRPSKAADGRWPVTVSNEGIDNVTVDYVGGMGDKFTADDTADTITTLHRYRRGQRIQLAVLKGDLPGGLDEATTYYVLSSGTTFQLSLEQSGTPVSLSDTGTDLQYVIRTTPIAQSAFLLQARILYDYQDGNVPAFVSARYDSLVERMRSPHYP